MSDNDDLPVGRVPRRREVLGLLGASGIALALAACGSSTKESAPPAPASTGTADGAGATGTTAAATAAQSAAATATTPAATATAAAQATTAAASAVRIVSPELTEGPYFVDEKLNRSDIRSDPSTGANRPGTPLALTINVFHAASNACTPLGQAVVDIWHCDAAGAYSDVSANNTVGQKWLRGNQTSDASGKVSFTTIYPGWYRGRAVHIHFKVRGTNAAGRTFEFTSQFFFEDAFSDEVYRAAAYAAKGSPDRRNANDNIYQATAGKTILKPTKSGDGYAATFNLGMAL
jgi:protocatechuate 3,4-dioxygenase beta subunit